MANYDIETLIDIKGLVDFHEDASQPEWGTDFSAPCKADSFSILHAPLIDFSGFKRDIPIIDKNCTFNWKIIFLDNGDAAREISLNSYDEENCIEMIKYRCAGLAWNDVFAHHDKHHEEGDSLFILENEKETKTFTFSTNQSFPVVEINYLIINYSIKFHFNYNEKTRYFKVDPFIKVRSGGGTN